MKRSKQAQALAEKKASACAVLGKRSDLSRTSRMQTKEPKRKMSRFVRAGE